MPEHWKKIGVVVCLLVIPLLLRPAAGQGITQTPNLPHFQGTTEYTQQGAAATIRGKPSVSVNSDSDPRGQGKAADGEEREFSMFWIIGIVINLLVFALFAIWGVREWRKTNNRRRS